MKKYDYLYFMLLFVPMVAQAQEFAYQRDILVPEIKQETSVWVPLDLHAQNSKGGLMLVDGVGKPVPFKQVTGHVNWLQKATVQSAPRVADTVPETNLSALTDNNPETYFQPVTAREQKFIFSFAEPVAGQFLVFQLNSGWIEHIQVRSGLTDNTLRDAYIGTPRGTRVPLAGTQAKVYEITIMVREGVLRIAEASLISPEQRLLFRAEPQKEYKIYYGTKDQVNLPDNGAVFTDAQAITAGLGPIEFKAGGLEDDDKDFVPNSLDNCPQVFNEQQEDSDGDGTGDVCDNAPFVPNVSQKDTDEDGIGDGQDNCPADFNPDQRDIDLDGIGWECDDADGDGVKNRLDNCVGLFNPDQQDLDNNDVGDACEDDRDGDGVPRTEDNCSTAFNPDQADSDGDKIGDACDVCPFHYDPAQIDRDGNGIGDVCQNQKEKGERDSDEDGIPDNKDNCPQVPNVNQGDDDDDGIGNVCDNCPFHKNVNQLDSNKDGQGDICSDSDSDGILDPYDNCKAYTNSDQHDQDEDGTGDPCDDDDGDGVENGRDNCRYDYNPYQGDEDRDEQGNVCDDTDNRWTEQQPWLLWATMGLIVIVLTGAGALILKKSAR